MEGSPFGSVMAGNEKNDLKVPLLQTLNNGTASVFPSVREKDDRLHAVMFKVGGISCASCAVSIEAAVGRLNGVQSVAVSPLQGHASVKYIPELISVSNLQPFNLENFFLSGIGISLSLMPCCSSCHVIIG